MEIHKYVQFFQKWLTPGIGLKRWLIILAIGIALLSLGFGVLLREFYPLPGVFHYVTLQFIQPRWLRASCFGCVGIAALVVALIGLNRALLAPYGETTPQAVIDAVYRHRRRGRGPKVVAIGGGHGLSVLLQGLKKHTTNITAIVTVADDGGSSGRLRRQLGVLPPGDLRNCIAALADDDALTTQLFQYRFSNGNGPHDHGLNGHNFGNLFITAMAEVTGSFERAILESGRVLAIQGQVLPSTLRDVTLMADLHPNAVGSESTGAMPIGLSRVSGESSITQAHGTIDRVYLVPDNAPAYPGALRAILEADLIVAGPGSLYTSVLPNLLVPDIARAIAVSQAQKVYVCNIATQPGETDGYDAGQHMTALETHVGKGLFSTVLVNNQQDGPQYADLVPSVFPPHATYQVVEDDLIDPAHPRQHDSHKLAQALLRLLSSNSNYAG